MTEDMGAIRTNRANPVNEAGPSYIKFKIKQEYE